METGRRPKAAFQTYLVQDYLFLIQLLSLDIFSARFRAGGTAHL
jgi:thiaminase